MSVSLICNNLARNLQSINNCCTRNLWISVKLSLSACTHCMCESATGTGDRSNVIADIKTAAPDRYSIVVC